MKSAIATFLKKITGNAVKFEGRSNFLNRNSQYLEIFPGPLTGSLIDN